MTRLSIDIETFSSINLKDSGLYRYVQSPDFEILLFGYAVDNDEPSIIDVAQGESVHPDLVRMLVDKRVAKQAYNAAFEYVALSKFYYTPLESWHCTMARALYCGYPTSLAGVTSAMNLAEDKKKMGVGKALINLFCKPIKPTAKNGQRIRTLPRHEPEKWDLFKEYCKRDVSAEREVGHLLSAFPMPESERRLWILDNQINAYGVRVDESLVDAAIRIDSVEKSRLLAEARSVSGLENPNSAKQLLEWLSTETNTEITSVAKDCVSDLLKICVSKNAEILLRIRQEISKTSVKKYEAMKNTIGIDGRVRGLLHYYGANRTGRWAGRLVQVQNLPRNYIQPLGLARELVKHNSVEAIKVIYGSMSNVLSQLTRTAFIASPGCTLVVADFSAIEARVIAWLAEEKWRQEVFATHGKIYEASASQMFGVPLEVIKKGNPEYALRAKGKVAELALGYQGASGALIQMGALNNGLTEEELPDIVGKWRAANKRIVDLWKKLEISALTAVREGIPISANKGIVFRLEASEGLSFLTIKLPSGRKLFYPSPHIKENEWGRDSLAYYGTSQESKKWGVIPTYGGKLTENIVQAIARDCLAEALLRVHQAGYQTVMHIHDEVVLDVPVEYADLAAVCDIMGQPIVWADGLLLKADGFVSDYYKKDD